MRNDSRKKPVRTKRAATVAALFAVVGMGLGATALLDGVTATPACAQEDGERKRRKSDEKATRLLKRMVTAEMKRAFSARESTLTADGRGTEQWVKHDPRRGVRRESIRPPGMVWIDDYKRSYRINTRENKVVEGDSLLPRPDEGRIQEFLRRFTGQLLQVEVVGEDRVSGRNTDIVSITGPATVRRFWVDRDTGLRLKTEEYNRAGRLLSSSYYVSIDLNPRFDDDDFEPPRNARVEREERRRFDSIRDAEKAGLKVNPPKWVPNGYRLRVVEAGRNDVVTLRYANGIDVLSLSRFDREKAPRRLKKTLEDKGSGFVPFPGGERGYVWREGDRTFLLISSLADDQVKRLVDSVR